VGSGHLPVQWEQSPEKDVAKGCPGRGCATGIAVFQLVFQKGFDLPCPFKTAMDHRSPAPAGSGKSRDLRTTSLHGQKSQIKTDRMAQNWK